MTAHSTTHIEPWTTTLVLGSSRPILKMKRPPRDCLGAGVRFSVLRCLAWLCAGVVSTLVVAEQRGVDLFGHAGPVRLCCGEGPGPSGRRPPGGGVHVVASFHAAVRVRRMRTRSVGVAPPQMPCRSFRAMAWSRHAARTGQFMHSCFALAVFAASRPSGKNRSGSSLQGP